MTPATILICSVGGSSAPIVTALKTLRPAFTCFVCTEGGAKTASITQVTGAGAVIKANFQDEKPTLPNIPTQAGLSEDSYDTLIVEPDDPDAIHARVRAKISELRRSHAHAKFVVDYTGGTKSMTASLLLAALEHSDIDLQLVVGQRQDLERVTDGTEVPMRANVDRIRFHSNWQMAMMPWRHYGYAHTVNSLTTKFGCAPLLEVFATTKFFSRNKT